MRLGHVSQVAVFRIESSFVYGADRRVNARLSLVLMVVTGDNIR